MAQNTERYDDLNCPPQNPITMSTLRNSSFPSGVPASTTEEELTTESDEPPEQNFTTGFQRSAIKPNKDPKESLLTKALMTSPDNDIFRPDILLIPSRRRSLNSNSTISSVELTSDGGLSPTHTNTPPSPPFPCMFTKHMASLNLGPKLELDPGCTLSKLNGRAPEIVLAQDISPPVTELPSAVEMLTKKRCIKFACGGQKPATQPPTKANVAVAPEKLTLVTSDNSAQPQKRACAIKFACTASVKPKVQETQPARPAEVTRRPSSRSPTVSRKPRFASPSRPSHRTSPSITRRSSNSQIATRRKTPAFLTSNAIQSSEATRFHEFASEVVEEDDWIRRDSSDEKKKLTINDTLRKENAIRQLGKEAEEEALQEEEDEQDDVDDEDEQQDSDVDENDENSDDAGLDGEETDGNETDNEAGFAESDDESDDEYQFWTPARSQNIAMGEAKFHRATPRRTTSESSIDSALSKNFSNQSLSRSSRVKIRPGTPDLPDSTDFVCGTLDEDRPLEEAYLSCMQVRKREKHRTVPQDIDPSFPVSGPEDEDEEDDVAHNDSDEHVWLHGKFEESDEHERKHRFSRVRKSPRLSPKRLHSPPPLKTRLRSPAPRRLFGGASPRRMRSPAPSRHIDSPRGSPTLHSTSSAIQFVPLGHRPGLTHTKSLPRTPNAFCKRYRALRVAAANGDIDGETADGYSRGAIDIVKGLERKKLCRKQSHRGRKVNAERKRQPGEGAERMRELALHGKGKTRYVLSI